ncbi:ABC transporter permease [Pontibacter sp. CAU 1760]
MGYHLLKRLLLIIPALWALGTIVFLLSRILPGSYASERILGAEAGFYSTGATADREAAYQAYLHRTGQDLPLFYFSLSPAALPKKPTGADAYTFLIPQFTWHGSHNQYQRWLRQATQGDFGTSLKNGQPVAHLLRSSVGNTLWLLLCSMLVALLVAFEASIRMVQGKGQWLRKLLLPVLFVLDSIPPFVLALLLLTLFANPDFLPLFPAFGMGYYTPQGVGLGQQLTEWLFYMALPLSCLVLFNLPYLTSQFYNALRAALQEDYIRTAKAKGLAEAKVIRKHAVRNALLPLITLLSDFIPALVAGTFIIETVFAVPGTGRLLIDSVLARDYPVLTGIILLVAAFRMLAYLLADLAYTWADPRIKQGGNA